MKIHVNAKYINRDVELWFGKYVNGSIAIKGLAPNGLPEFVATIALDEKPQDGHVFLKGWTENEGIPEALAKAGVVELTGRTIPTGFCEAEEAKLLCTLTNE